MAKNIKNLIVALIQDAAEKRCPKLRYIDGQPYAYCHVRKEWRRVRFNVK
jgi:hypothetical protein